MESITLFHLGKFDVADVNFIQKDRCLSIQGIWTIYDPQILTWLSEEDRKRFTFEDGAIPKWKTSAILNIYKVLDPVWGVRDAKPEDVDLLDPDHIFDYTVHPKGG